MHRSRLAAIVIDCKTDDLGRDTAFWSGALGLPVSAGPEGTPPYAELAVPAGEPKVLLQQVEHESRVHLDIETDDVEAEVKRWWVMEAPSGQRFCVVRPQRADFPDGATAWE